MGDFIGDKQCVTHHNACDCREEYFRSLKTNNEWLKKELAEFQEAEGAICPEDVGFVEYIKALKDENKQLRAKTISSLQRELANQCIKFTKQSDGGFANIPLGFNLGEDIGLITQAEQALKGDK